jgi:lipoprotein NlpD
MAGLRMRWVLVSVLMLLGSQLTGCGSKVLNHAPVEDRGASVGKPAAVTTDPAITAAVPVKQPAGYENAGKPGYYTVKAGDTLLRIGLDHGQSAKDIARWSALENPNRIEVGQVLRVAPPVPGSAAPAAGVVVKPVSSSNATPVASAPLAPASADKGTVVASAAATAPAASASTVPAEDEINWLWPSAGAVLAGFDEQKNKGLDLGGAAGDPVLAAADGRVVYVGAGLRGYGNLIILKHNNTYLTAYAHNQTLLIKEDQSVRKGQKIAEMGNSDADRVKLHFELRRQGKPVDPTKYLPPR